MYIIQVCSRIYHLQTFFSVCRGAKTLYITLYWQVPSMWLGKVKSVAPAKCVLLFYKEYRYYYTYSIVCSYNMAQSDNTFNIALLLFYLSQVQISTCIIRGAAIPQGAASRRRTYTTANVYYFSRLRHHSKPLLIYFIFSVLFFVFVSRPLPCRSKDYNTSTASPKT